MSNWKHVTLDVLASSPEEINKIETALQQPCEELLAWVAKRWGKGPKEVAADVKALVTFKPTRNLLYTEPSIDKDRRFTNSFRHRFTGIVWSHVDLVSENFPEAIFLAEHCDQQASLAGKIVIRAGEEIRSVYDGNEQAQGFAWVLPDIFAPYRAEHDLGVEFGSLWDKWLSGMQRELASLKAH